MVVLCAGVRPWTGTTPAPRGLVRVVMQDGDGGRLQRQGRFGRGVGIHSDEVSVNGKVVYSGNGDTASGNHQFSWNVKDNNGNQLADGTYTLTVSPKAPDGSTVTSQVASAGVVNEIDMTSGTPQLLIGNMKIGLGDIANIASVTN